MGSLVRSGGNALAAYGGVNPFAEAGRGAEQGDYLKFNGNTGEITYGGDDEILPPGSLLVFDLNTYQQGFICWKESQVAEEVLVNILDGKPPREADLTDHGPYDDDDDGWREAGSISAVILEHGADPKTAASHPDVGKGLILKTSTGGVVRSLKKLSLAYGRVFMTKPGQLPIVEVTTEEYTPKVKKHGKKHALNLKIIDWITEDDLASIAQADGPSDDDYEEPTPAPAQRGRAAPAPVEEEEAPAPRRRAAAPAPVEEEEAPAPRRRAAPAPVEEEEAPAPRRRAAPAPVEDEIEDEAPAPRSRRAAAPAADEPEDDGDSVPAPRGRSPGRGAPPANARVRRFQ